VVATSRSELGQSLLDREEVARALAGENVSIFRRRVFDQAMPPVASISRGNRVRVFVALPVVHDGRVLGAVVLSRTPLDIIKALYINRPYLFKGAIILICAMVLISLLTTLLISKPITALTAQAGNISSGKQGSAGPLKKPGTHEVDLLSHAFSNMAVSLQDRADYIRSFASHVSHEFKTPLASMGGAVELLREHFDGMSPREREKFLRNMAQDIDRLTLLVSRLLELARADMHTPARETLELCAALDSLVKRYIQGGLAIRLCPCSPPLPVWLSVETLESVIGNLIANSRLHGGDTVSITISAGASDADKAKAEIVFSDNGPGISAANIDKIFTPFFTTARDRGGSGLGLSIIRALVRAHKGDIVCLPADGGARFKITLVRQIMDRDA
jgi:signal transduction histidine kinase